MDPPLEEEEREPLDCESQPISDSPKIEEDLVGSEDFESSGSLREDSWLAMILVIVVASNWLVAVYNDEY
jgi:hypothetical protein